MWRPTHAYTTAVVRLKVVSDGVSKIWAPFCNRKYHLRLCEIETAVLYSERCVCVCFLGYKCHTFFIWQNSINFDCKLMYHSSLSYDMLLSIHKTTLFHITFIRIVSRVQRIQKHIHKHTVYFRFISISLTVSNILMKMWSTSMWNLYAHTHTSIYMLDINILWMSLCPYVSASERASKCCV